MHSISQIMFYTVCLFNTSLNVPCPLLSICCQKRVVEKGLQLSPFSTLEHPLLITLCNEERAIGLALAMTASLNIVWPIDSGAVMYIICKDVHPSVWCVYL